MAFILQVDGDRWRSHLRMVRDSVQAVADTRMVPVIKGNGYGLGQATLARESSSLGCDVVAVGTAFEVEEVLAHTLADVVVLEPYEPRDHAASTAWSRLAERWDAGRIIRTVASSSALRALSESIPRPRVLIEGRTSMQRFGFTPLQATRIMDELGTAAVDGDFEIVGLTLHLPLVQPSAPASTDYAATGRVHEVLSWINLWNGITADTHPSSRIWLSHVDDVEVAAVRQAAGNPLNVRIGSRLWLGERAALSARGAVLAVHPVAGRSPVGYRQRTGPRDGTVVIVSGGTAHGIGLSAPSPAASLRQRVVTAGTGALDAAGRSLSPFSWQGRQRWFAETPHQHHSMLWLPRGCAIPEVGDQLTADIRFTTTHFDSVIGLEAESIA